MKQPLILVTNDDGITAPGLKMLVSVARQLGEVIVIAPDSPQSAKGHAITISDPIRLRKAEIFEGIESYECSGTPADCVKLGKYILKERTPDLCLSGVNHGSNASINIIYSGTVSAAMEASIEGIPSIAFSLTHFSWEADFEPCRPFLKQITEYVLEHGLSKCKLLNVNIPTLPLEQIKGIKICRQSQSHWVEEFKEAIDPRGVPYYWLTGKFENADMGEDSDVWALDNGYVSVVPSWHDLTKYDALDGLKPMENLS